MSYPAIQFPRKAQILFRPAPYKVLYSGRGAGKSWAAARALILIAHTTPPSNPITKKPLRILCCREVQASIKDSVHTLLCDQIVLLGLGNDFYITEKIIVSKVTGAEFIFKGLRMNKGEIKSMEGINIAWVEEAQFVSAESWEILGPTVFRNEGAEIWVTFNPDEENDATYRRFITHPPKKALVERMHWSDNAWFSNSQNDERLRLLELDYDMYCHVWDGECKVIGDAVIFKGKYQARVFDWREIARENNIQEQNVRWFHGNDFGFANDPNALIRSFITEEIKEVSGKRLRFEDLWVEREVFGYGTEIDNLPDLFDGKLPNKAGMDSARRWPIMADSSRPEIISYLSRHGFNMRPADKWSGSVEDGIAHLKMFRNIYIHTTNCPKTLDEFRQYSYKVDKKKLDADGKPEVLPIIVDKFNHAIDSIRYSLDGYIKRRGASAIWEALAK